ncbi:MAG: hypothetical protein HY821_16090 [Acidobacteria bacterium]|nr:hypothetical protein [Acidobacteriota bacterium]
MRTPFLLLLSLSALLPAQEVVAPTPERTGEPRGANSGDYNIVQDWEFGYRFRTVDGDLGKYRSDVNYGNGVRLLSSRLLLRSRDGKGRWFDELSLFTQGLGNDPYETATLRFSKNRLYRYDGAWRSSQYYNPALTISSGQHAMDTTRRIQDHDFTLFPQSRIKFFAGFSRVSQQGPALATVNLFDGARGDEFPLFANIDRRQNELRVGNELVLLGIRINWMQSWEFYRENSPLLLNAPSSGANPSDRTSLSSYSSKDPIEGLTPSFRLNLFRERSENWAFNGRFTYSAGRRDFAFDESAVGVDRFGAARNQQTLVSGNARRPIATGAATLSFFPHSRFTITNHTAYNSTRMEGDSYYQQLQNGTLDSAAIHFQYLGIRLVTNVTDGTFQATRWLLLRGGYQYSQREVDSVQQVEIEGFPAGQRNSQQNRLHTGLLGFRLQPLKSLTLAADGEVGRQDKPFYPTSDKDYQGYSARARWKSGPWQLSAMLRSSANLNSASLFSHSARLRQFTSDGSWNPRSWMSLDAGYAQLHLATATGIAYFLPTGLVQGQQSIFLSNLHTAHLGWRVSIRERVDLYAGLAISKDTGAGSGARPTLLPAFAAVQAYPMDFDAPLARISVKLHTKLRWNAGYQFYRYRDDLFASQNYRAHTGYTSVLWTF